MMIVIRGVAGSLIALAWLFASSSFAAASDVSSDRDTISPVYDWKTFPYTWDEIRGGKFTLMPVHWERSASNPVIPQGMNSRPVLVDASTVRVYFGVRGPKGGICSFDIDPREPEKFTSPPTKPFLSPSEPYDDDWVLAPEPVKISDTHVRMYYAAKRKGSFFGGVWSLACADSHDAGKTWRKYSGNPILTVTSDPWESGAVGFASVEKLADGWQMWYLGTNQDRNALKQVGYATSKDGLKWDRYAHNPVLPADPENHWEKGAIAVPRVIRDGKLYRVWYCCYPQNDTYAIGCAESADGIRWTRSPHNPVMKASGKGWDSQMTGYPGVVRFGDRYLMWYSGDSYGSKGVGLATASIPKGNWLYRTGKLESGGKDWSPWLPLRQAPPPREGFVQFAVQADEK